MFFFFNLFFIFFLHLSQANEKETQAQLSKAHTHKTCSPANFTFSRFFFVVTFLSFFFFFEVMSAGSPSILRERKTYYALRDAYVAAAQVPDLLNKKNFPGSSQAQRDAIEKWATTYLTSTGAPPELTQDSVQWLQTVAAVPSDKSGEITSSFAALQSTSFSAEQFSPQQCCVRRGDSLNGCGSTDVNQPRTPFDDSLDVDHCTIANIIEDEDRLWKKWHGTRYGASECASVRNGSGGERGCGDAYASDGPSSSAVEDVFSPEAVQREVWQCWAAVLRDVKVEAAVQQKQGIRCGGTHTMLDSLLDNLKAPETPWLLEDPPSSILMAADMYMANRAYAARTITELGGLDGDGEDEADRLNSYERIHYDTLDMEAVHAYLVRQDADKPPLRSLLELTLASHIGEQSEAS